MNNVLFHLNNSRSISEAREALWAAFYDVKARPTSDCNIALLTLTCHGFGDAVFSMKLYQYLKSWYNAKVTIITSTPELFSKLGMNMTDVIILETNGRKECRRAGNFGITVQAVYDLIFVTPLQLDFDISDRDIRQLIPYSNLLNTYYFSEYNDRLDKGFDFPTGVGRERLGLFLTDTNVINKDLLSPFQLPEFVLAYLGIASLTSALRCFRSFTEMVLEKYQNVPDIHIIAPLKLTEGNMKPLQTLANTYRRKLRIIVEKGTKPSTTTELTLTLRFDILSVSNEVMLALMKFSLPDILLTGDQSITDCLSCCHSGKNIWYQIVPWKTNFARSLSREMNNPYLRIQRTSCGDLEGINFTGNYNRFLQRWDFRTLGRPKVDALVQYAVESKNNPQLRELTELVLRSRSVYSLKSKLGLQ